MSHRISLRSLYKLFIWLPHSTAEKISEGCLISTISTCIGKHHCCKCFSEVACHEDWCCQDHRLALRCRGIVWERCCSMLLLASSCNAACKLCMVYTLSPLAFRPASDKSSNLSSRNLFRLALAEPFDMPRTSKQKWCHAMSFPHAGNLLRKKLQSCNWTHPTNSHLFMRAFCLIIRAIKLTVFFACLVMLATLRSFWVWGLAMEVSLRSDLTPCHPMCTARLEGLNLLDKEGTERGSKVATALNRILWAATGRFGCG